MRGESSRGLSRLVVTHHDVTDHDVGGNATERESENYLHIFFKIARTKRQIARTKRQNVLDTVQANNNSNPSYCSQTMHTHNNKPFCLKVIHPVDECVYIIVI